MEHCEVSHAQKCDKSLMHRRNLDTATDSSRNIRPPVQSEAHRAPIFVHLEDLEDTIQSRKSITSEPSIIEEIQEYPRYGDAENEEPSLDIKMEPDIELEFGSRILRKVSLFSILREEEISPRKNSPPKQGHKKLTQTNSITQERRPLL